MTQELWGVWASTTGALTGRGPMAAWAKVGTVNPQVFRGTEAQAVELAEKWNADTGPTVRYQARKV